PFSHARDRTRTSVQTITRCHSNKIRLATTHSINEFPAQDTRPTGQTITNPVIHSEFAGLVSGRLERAL
ncbi:hypothetical protein ACIQZO_40335, partial [Streptomyces sp. NPDC097617]|uniref:hypothetical protein n=1 Tax=Streptomyces sp. NPDC097617 TaxID=3366091 RepID=UPI003826A0A0